jgi:hypothetical protein
MKKGISAVLSSGKVNRHGYRLLVEGARLQSFIDNPIMLYVHRRASAYDAYEDIATPIGKWDNIRIENSQLVADPNFDMEDEFAAKIARKWEQGYLNATSVRHTFDKVSEEIDLVHEGQTRVTVTEWEVLEASIVDIPGDKEAVKLDFSNNNDPLSKLPLLSVKSSSDMDLKSIALSLGLKQDATEAEVTAKIAAMKAQQVEGILALGRQKGVVNDTNLNDMRALVNQNPEFAQLSWGTLQDAKTEVVPAVVPPVASQGTLAAALRADGKSGAIADERNCWTIKEWRQRDPNGLLSLETGDPAKFNSLVDEMVTTGFAVR